MFENQVLTTPNSLWTWFKDHTVHFMVLINGIILTLATFWTVHLFIGQLLKEDYLQSGMNAKQATNEKLIDFENTRQDFATTFQIYSLSPTGDFVDNPVTSGLNARLFDSIIWIPAKNPLAAIDLKNRSVAGTPRKAIDPALVNSIVKQAQSETKAFLFINPKTSSRMEDGVSILQTRPFSIVQTIKGNGGQDVGYLAVFSSIETILNHERILSNTYVSKTVFWEEETRAIIYYLEDTEKEDFFFGNNFKYDFDIVFAGKPIKVQVVFKKSSNNLLELLSWLVAGFGIIVTIIVWFYVSNNYRKSRSLSKVNADLAEKNDELNDQIREREKLFQILRKSERENFAIINAISDVIFEVSPSGEVLFLNEAWERITGFDIETSLGKNIFDMINPSDRDEQRQSISLLAKGQKTAYRQPTKIRTIEGTFRSVEIAVTMLRQDEAKNLRVMGSFTDIEERQRAEKALNEAEAKYKTIWENAAGGIYQLTSQGVLLSANPALARIFGYFSAEDMMQNVKNAHEELFTDPRGRVEFLKHNLSQSKESLTYESQALRRNGEKIWVRENIRAVLDGMSNIIYYEGSIEDITQRKESEVQLKEAKVRSDMANRAKSEFLANISHELRTPLNSIIGFSEIIRNQVFGPIEPKSYTEYAGNIYDSGKHLLSIINQILDISRIDAGERELNESLVDIRKITTLCLDMMRAKITQGGLTIVDLIPADLPKMVAEEVAVKQMLLNLLSNAAKFTPHGGRITLSAEIESSGNFRVSVTDTGVGLTNEQIEKSAMPFGLVDGRLDKGTGGAGLGLSLVHALLKLHGGKLELLSQKGIGTTATLVFPASRIQ